MVALEQASKANIILVGNKCDRTEHRVVTTAEGQQLADEFGILFVETSAKDDVNVESAFVRLAAQIHQRLQQEDTGKVVTGILLDQKKSDKKRSCWFW